MNYWLDLFGFTKERNLGRYDSNKNFYGALESFIQNHDSLYECLEEILSENDDREIEGISLNLEVMDNSTNADNYDFSLNLKYRNISVLECYTAINISIEMLQFLILYHTYYLTLYFANKNEIIEYSYNEVQGKFNDMDNFFYSIYDNIMIHINISDTTKNKELLEETAFLAMSRACLSLNIDDLLKDFEETDFDQPSEMVENEKKLIKRINVMKNILIK